MGQNSGQRKAPVKQDQLRASKHQSISADESRIAMFIGMTVCLEYLASALVTFAVVDGMFVRTVVLCS